MSRVWAADEPEVQEAVCDGCRAAAERRQLVTFDAHTFAQFEAGEFDGGTGLPVRVWTLCEGCQADGAAERLHAERAESGG